MEASMTRSVIFATGVVSALLVAACASTGEPRAGARDMNVITAEEIAASNATTAHDLIRNLRPRWLHDRGQQSLGTVQRQGIDGPVAEMATTGIVVYVDGSRMGAVAVLRDISARDLTSAQRLSAGEATQRFGGGHPHGAILLTTR
jgi:hypothetical protein